MSATRLTARLVGKGMYLSGMSLTIVPARVALTAVTLLPTQLVSSLTHTTSVTWLNRHPTRPRYNLGGIWAPLVVSTVIQTQSKPSHPISLMSMLILFYHLCFGFPKGLSPFNFPTNSLYKMKHNWWLILFTHATRMYLLYSMITTH
jgi:putative effector of murein hydrolase LrgA (UPF0299 family)